MGWVWVDTGLRNGRQVFENGIESGLCHSCLYVDADVPASKPLLEERHMDPSLLRITYIGYRVGISGKTNRNSGGPELAGSRPLYAPYTGKHNVSQCKAHITIPILCLTKTVIGVQPTPTGEVGKLPRMAVKRHE